MPLMLEAGLVFLQSLDDAARSLATLPAPLRPVQFFADEDQRSADGMVSDATAFAAFIRANPAGFFMRGQGLSISLRAAGGQPTVCDVFLDMEPSAVVDLMRAFAQLRPFFAFACEPAEREARNRLTVHQGVNRIEAWVGRDPRRGVPGLYWLTYLSASLMATHRLSTDQLEPISLRTERFSDGGVLVQRYAEPNQWLAGRPLAEEELPGVFRINALREAAEKAKNFLELQLLLKPWR